MANSWIDFQTKLEKGELAPIKLGGNSGSYEDSTFTVLEAKFVQHKDLPERMQTSFEKDGVYWKFEIEVKTETGKEKITELFSPALTRAGDIACYPTSGDFTGTLLYDIVHGIKELGETPMPENWLEDIKNIEKNLTAKKGSIKAKISDDGAYVFIETSYQKKKDAEYKAENSTQEDKESLETMIDDMNF